MDTPLLRLQGKVDDVTWQQYVRFSYYIHSITLDEESDECKFTEGKRS